MLYLLHPIVPLVIYCPVHNMSSRPYEYCDHSGHAAALQQNQDVARYCGACGLRNPFYYRQAQLPTQDDEVITVEESPTVPASQLEIGATYASPTKPINRNLSAREQVALYRGMGQAARQNNIQKDYKQEPIRPNAGSPVDQASPPKIGNRKKTTSIAVGQPITIKLFAWKRVCDRVEHDDCTTELQTSEFRLIGGGEWFPILALRCIPIVTSL
jgi:hypothetical protein